MASNYRSTPQLRRVADGAFKVIRVRRRRRAIKLTAYGRERETTMLARQSRSKVARRPT